MQYHIIENFKLDKTLEQSLQNIDWKVLPVTTKYNKSKFLRMLIKNKICFNGLLHYGWCLQKVGNLISLRLPDKLEKNIRQQIKNEFGSLLSREAVIRLQICYGGEIIPIHIDLTRQSSIVYPITHEYNSFTVFYSCENVNTRELIDPKKCEFLDKVSIADSPVLLNTNIPHSVNYDKNIYTHENPRISLTIKFEKLNFSTVMQKLTK